MTYANDAYAAAAYAGSAAANSDPSGSITAVLPALSANLSGVVEVTGTITAVLPALAGSLTGSYSDTGTITATLPGLSASLAGHVLGRAGFGLVLDSSATITVDAALDSAITSTTVPLHVVTPTVPVPTLVDGRPS